MVGFARKASYAAMDVFLQDPSAVHATAHTAKKGINVVATVAYQREANAVEEATTAHQGISAYF